MRSEFEKYFKENHADSFYSVDAALEMRGDDYIDFHAADLWALWQHQQSKVDELQKRFDELERYIKWVVTFVDLQIEATEQGREAAIGIKEKNRWSSKLLMLRPVRRVLEQALKGGEV